MCISINLWRDLVLNQCCARFCAAAPRPAPLHTSLGKSLRHGRQAPGAFIVEAVHDDAKVLVLCPEQVARRARVSPSRAC